MGFSKPSRGVIITMRMKYHNTQICIHCHVQWKISPLTSTSIAALTCCFTIKYVLHLHHIYIQPNSDVTLDITLDFNNAVIQFQDHGQQHGISHSAFRTTFLLKPIYCFKSLMNYALCPKQQLLSSAQTRMRA